MRTNPTHTIPSLSGTFGIPTRLALNPKMPKEPSSPSRSNTRKERRYIENETNKLTNNNGQRTSCIVHLADSANFEDVAINELCSGLIGSCFESLNDTIHNVVGNKQRSEPYNRILTKEGKNNLFLYF